MTIKTGDIAYYPTNPQRTFEVLGPPDRYGYIPLRDAASGSYSVGESTRLRYRGDVNPGGPLTTRVEALEAAVAGHADDIERMALDIERNHDKQVLDNKGRINDLDETATRIDGHTRRIVDLESFRKRLLDWLIKGAGHV